MILAIYYLNSFEGVLGFWGLSENDYDNLMESLEMLSIPGFRESLKKSAKQIERGETVSLEDAFGDD